MQVIPNSCYQTWNHGVKAMSEVRQTFHCPGVQPVNMQDLMSEVH